jgi:hypothetical protein
MIYMSLLQPLIKSQNGKGGITRAVLDHRLIYSNTGLQSSTNIQSLQRLRETILQFQQPQLHQNEYLAMVVILLLRNGTDYRHQQLDIYFAYGIGVIYQRQMIAMQTMSGRNRRLLTYWRCTIEASISFLYTLFIVLSLMYPDTYMGIRIHICGLLTDTVSYP